MDNKEALIAQIEDAFAEVTYPGDANLKGSTMGDEPFIVEKAFSGKTNWRNIDPTFLNLAPDNLASALSFFSNEAFHFYIPAYLIADVRGQLHHSNPLPFNPWFIRTIKK